MSNLYLELKQRQAKEFESFPIMFAFNKEQFAEGMKRLGLEPTDTDKIYNGFGGGFYRKTDAERLHGMFERFDKEFEEAIAADETGDGFVLDMFSYELANHEYGYTGDLAPTLRALGLSIDEIQESPKMLQALQKACQSCFND